MHAHSHDSEFEVPADRSAGTMIQARAQLRPTPADFSNLCRARPYGRVMRVRWLMPS